MTDIEVRWERLGQVSEPVGVPERTLSAPGSIDKPTQEIQTNSERCLDSYGYSVGGLQVIPDTLGMYISNQLPLTANMMYG
jgi:hypothetical protein